MALVFESEILETELIDNSVIAAAVSGINISVLAVAMNAEEILVWATMTSLTTVVAAGIDDSVVLPVNFVAADGTEWNGAASTDALVAADLSLKNCIAVVVVVAIVHVDNAFKLLQLAGPKWFVVALYFLFDKQFCRDMFVLN